MSKRNRNRNDTLFWESATDNNMTYNRYYMRLCELAISMFEWKNLPPTVDPRYLELMLFSRGYCMFFEDEEMGYLTLSGAIGGKLDVYRIPDDRRAMSANGYNRQLNEKDSVIIYNNMLHTNTEPVITQFAKRLSNLDRTIDVNAYAQRTPVLILCNENERLTMENLYMKYDGHQPVIMGEKDLNTKGIRALNTGAPFVCDKLYELKTQIWNEALTYLGITNNSFVKKERMLTDEVARNNGGTIASRYSRLESRRKACEQINKMFKLNVWVDYREDYQLLEKVETKTEEDKAEETTDSEVLANE